jgi:hypothetical protein
MRREWSEGDVRGVESESRVSAYATHPDVGEQV